MDTTAYRSPGRPEAGEFADYAAEDIGLVRGDDIFAILQSLMASTAARFSTIEDQRAGAPGYAPGKWTLKEILAHLADDERIFAHRMLRIARGDSQPLAGFDENEFVRHGRFGRLSMAHLLEEYRLVRLSTLSLIRGFDPEAWLRRGQANGYIATPRGLAFHIAGHELHHLRVLEEKYLA